MTETIVEGEIIEDVPSVELVPIAPAALSFVDDPEEFLDIATKQAKVLKRFLDNSNSVIKIGRTEHVKIGGWQFLAQQAGLSVGTSASEIRLEDDTGWKAHAIVYRGGLVVGEADALCLRSEANWKNRDAYAICSMAQTRAISKAIKGVLGFVVVMAGYSDTPAEEMPRDTPPERPAPPPRTESRQRSTLPGETFEDIFEGAVTTEPGEQKASASQKKKLDVLVGQLREAGKLHTEHLYSAVEALRTNGLSDVADVGGGLLPDADPDGTLHWSKLRETLTREEAHNLIDRLSTLQSHVEPVASRRADP